MIRKTLVTGTAGLIGSHLAEALIDAGEEVIATYLNPTIDITDIASKVDLVSMDINDFRHVCALVTEHKPGVIYHLAAQSLPTVSWIDPWTTMQTNVIGTVNMFEAIKTVKAEDPGYDPVVVVACSSAEYGASLTPDKVPILEDAQLLPMHPYGVSKVGQDLLTLQYWFNDRIRGVRARLFNCTGPRKQNDVVSDFGSRIVRVIREGGTLMVGNLQTRRAIVDVRDMVDALLLLAEKGHAGEAYNVCAERIWAMQEILDMYLSIANRPISWAVDPKLLRPSDEPVIVGSTAKLKAHTGWAQRIPIEKTIRDVFDYETVRQAR